MKRFIGRLTWLEKLPAKAGEFKATILILGLASPFWSFSTAQTPSIADSHRDWVADRIFANECRRQIDCLTSWNAGEDFPSMGLGHFIWYPAGRNEPFTETFPALLHYFRQRSVALPQWLEQSASGDAPWDTREQFYREFESPRMTGLRKFLADTLPLQADFIEQRQRQALGRILAAAPERADEIEALYHAMALARPPYGRYALIDYVNFKGEGNSPAERYQGQGWGLLQVLEHMLDSGAGADLPGHFAASAGAVLARRVANAPPERNEQRWLDGWLRRVATYVPPPEPDGGRIRVP